MGSWDLGSGDSTAEVQFDFLTGESYLFEVSFDSSITGRDLFDVIATEADTVDGLEFTFDYIAYSFGDFLVGVGINDAYDYGEGSPPDYLDTWGYWISDGTDDWASSMVGFSDRVLVDGSRDGWVFGTGLAPASIPAPATIAVFAFGLGRRRRD
ncbi:MAG: hypothetical protein CMJ23_13420 [Phycisphaerae bacterium]|nr:hypothetical protein [Phycisphaerae bacterium]